MLGPSKSCTKISQQRLTLMIGNCLPACQAHVQGSPLVQADVISLQMKNAISLISSPTHGSERMPLYLSRLESISLVSKSGPLRQRHGNHYRSGVPPKSSFASGLFQDSFSKLRTRCSRYWILSRLSVFAASCRSNVLLSCSSMNGSRVLFFPAL